MELNLQNGNYSDIVGHILKEHHAYLKDLLPELENLTFTIFRVHFQDTGDVLDEVYKKYNYLKTDFNSHIIKEERALFFMIKDYEKSPSEELLEDIHKLIEFVEKDNEKIEEYLRDIRRVTNNFTLPASSCMTYENTFAKLEELESNTLKHLEIEKELFMRLREEMK